MTLNDEKHSTFQLTLYVLWFTAWEGAVLTSSPGDSIQSYSGTSSPPLSDDGNVSSSSSSVSSNDQKYIIKNHHKLQINQHSNVTVNQARRGQRTISLSTSDEGIVMDYGEEMPRKRRVSFVSSFYFPTSINFVVKSAGNGHNHSPNTPMPAAHIKPN